MPNRFHTARRGLVPLWCALLLGAAVSSAQAQTAIARGNVNLRQDASTFYPPITLIPAGTTLTLLSSVSVEHYYHVRTPDGREGWVWDNNIHIQVETISVPMSTQLPGELPQLAVCNIPDTQKIRWGQKTRDVPPPGYQEVQETVEGMLDWVVPINLPPSARMSDEPLGLEKFSRVYALSGFVRLVKQEEDCDYYIEVAASQDENAPRVIVEVPLKYTNTQRMVMKLVGMQDAQRSRTFSASDAPRLTFVGYAFLDQWHQSGAHPTQAGTQHGTPGLVQTLWELHPVWEVR